MQDSDRLRLGKGRCGLLLALLGIAVVFFAGCGGAGTTTTGGSTSGGTGTTAGGFESAVAIRFVDNDWIVDLIPNASGFRSRVVDIRSLGLTSPLKVQVAKQTCGTVVNQSLWIADHDDKVFRQVGPNGEVGAAIAYTSEEDTMPEAVTLADGRLVVMTAAPDLTQDPMLAPTVDLNFRVYEAGSNTQFTDTQVDPGWTAFWVDDPYLPNYGRHRKTYLTADNGNNLLLAVERGSSWVQWRTLTVRADGSVVLDDALLGTVGVNQINGQTRNGLYMVGFAFYGVGAVPDLVPEGNPSHVLLGRDVLRAGDEIIFCIEVDSLGVQLKGYEYVAPSWVKRMETRVEGLRPGSFSLVRR